VILTALAVVAVLVLAFAGYNPDDPAKGRVVVRYWEKWNGKEADDMMQIVNDFNNTVGKEKGIYVQYLSMSNVHQKTLVSTAAGAPPEIAGLDDHDVVTYAIQNALEPMDDLAKAHGIDENYYLPVYWNGLHYNGHLWGLVSTPAAVALHYNRRAFLEHSAQLKAAGLDPNRAPRTLDELDRYAGVLNEFKTGPDGKKNMQTAGYLPAEPGWFKYCTPYWFGAQMYDEKTHQLHLNDAAMVKALTWYQGYAKRLGKDSLTNFSSGLGSFASAQNGFLTGLVDMEQQGPWMANFIEKFNPTMNRWNLPADTDISQLSHADRLAHSTWAAAPFPSAVVGLENVTYTPFDVLVIPKGAKHQKEAFEFLAYVNRQDVIEKLNSLQCKNSPLQKVSPGFLAHHPNPYVDVFEKLAASPNARPVPKIPILNEVTDEVNNAFDSVYLLQKTPQEAADYAQARAQAKLDDFFAKQAVREGGVKQ